MRLRKIRIVIKPWDEVWRDAKRVGRRLPHGERHPEWTKDTLYFTSLEEIRTVLTDRRIALLRLIHQEKPRSIQALAALVGRDFKNVNADVHLLSRLGLVDIADGDGTERRRGRKAPRVPYRTVSVEIPLAS
jgi:predicted transcriptional regulator